VRVGQTLGVIDIGSNSGRVLVARVQGAAHLDVLGDARSPLRLVRDVARAGRLSPETIERTLRIVRGFLAVATCSGAERTLAVATAAVREASNGEQFIERARAELGIPVNIADGDEEARFGFLGAIHGLPVRHGIVLDVGGGSLQLVHFRGRRLVRSSSLSLGALRLSDRFLKSDPASRGEMRALKEQVYADLEKVGIRPLLADERLVGTGGTVRNLAKVDRRMRGEYPISRLHAYGLERRGLDGVTSLLAGTPANTRAAIPGLNGDRADSIVGGALVVQAVMDCLLASDLTVAGYGLREGIALHSVTDEAASVDDVQAAADALVAMQKLVAEAIAAGADNVDANTLDKQVALYRSAAQIGITQTAARSSKVMKKHNALARRLLNRQDDYLRFTTDWRIPPDNNGSERDIRMIKLRQKMSGCLRTLTGAQQFCAIRSYLSTAAKHGKHFFDTLVMLAEGQPWLPTTD